MSHFKKILIIAPCPCSKDTNIIFKIDATFLWWIKVWVVLMQTKQKAGRGRERSEREDCKPYTLTSHTITHSNQEAQRKAGGLRSLREALGGLDTRRNSDGWFQLSDGVVTEGHGQASKSSVSTRWGAERMWGRTGNRRIQAQHKTVNEWWRKYIEVRRGTQELDNKMEKWKCSMIVQWLFGGQK